MDLPQYRCTDGTTAWIDTSGHLINANRDRIDCKGRTTKARGQPGRGFIARRDQHRLFQQQQQSQLNRQREQLERQEQQLRQRQPHANVQRQPLAKAGTSSSSHHWPERVPLQSQPQLQPRPSQQQQQQPQAAPINEPPPVAQASAKAAAKAAPGSLIYDNSRTFGDVNYDWQGWLDQGGGGIGGSQGYDMGP